MPAILLCISLLHFTIAVASNPQYILWVSSVVQSNSMERACVHLLNLNESVSLNVVIEHDGSNTTIFDQSVKEDTFYGCAHFKVSQKSSERLAFITLLVKGNTLQISERRSVVITSAETVTFVQTDKPIYKPGDKINYRTVTLDTQLKPVKDLYPLITLQDPQNNVIFQWKNVTSVQNITQLSFQLSSEPLLGDYTIAVEGKSGQTWTHQFTVNKDVLPKFEVKVSAPQTVTISDDEFQVDACAKYTHGGSVQGKAQMRVCREVLTSGNCEEGVNEMCEQFVAQLKNGCVSQIVNTKVFQISRSGLSMTFHVNVIVTESGTGAQVSEKTSVAITEVLGSVRFENMDSVYRRGISYSGTLKFYGPNNMPLPNKLLQLELGGRAVGNYTTDENGEAQFSIDTSDVYDPVILLQAEFLQPESCHLPGWVIPHYSEDFFSVPRFYSRTNSFLKIVREPRQLRCDQEKTITVHYALNQEAYEGDSCVNFFYLMMVKGAIILNGQKEIRNKAWNGHFSLLINISADLAPAADLLVYTVHPTGEIVADSVKFHIDQCFKNKVGVQFSTEQQLPGSNTTLHLQAAPDSFCALRAVDRSALLLRPEQQLSAESVYNMLPYTEPYGYFYNGLNLDDGHVEPCIPQKNMFYNGLYYTPVTVSEDEDTYEILKRMGLKVFTNLHYRKPELCVIDETHPYIRPVFLGRERSMPYASPVAYSELRENANHVQQAITETVRTNFPETWIWDLFSVDSSGSANLSLVVPDAVTEWEASAFCVNGEAGFGLSPTASLRVSQAFFVEIATPFSVVRNEQCDLIISVFSYLDTCAEISVQLETSRSYEANINTFKSNDSEIIQAGEKKTYVWTFRPKTLGKVNITVVAESRQSSACQNKAAGPQNLNWKDVVVKTMLVEPEGIEKEMTQSSLICTKGTKASKQVVLELPNNIVEGSARAFFIVVGDILGVSMQNLENLLQMPYGWGEQNIALLASNTYILDYLKATKQLTEEVKSKASFLLSNGYQKQLSFKNSDGSYSVFWQRNNKGDIRFSVLTYKTFERMKEYTFIDRTVQTQTLIWLLSKQKPNGCFETDGEISNTAWESPEEEDIVLTASIVVMFLETGLNSTFPALRNGLFCLEDALQRGVTNGYIHAILAYTLALAGKEEQVESLLQDLDQSATKINNVIYWEKEEKSKTDSSASFTPWAPSGQTEKTCYVLLAVLTRRSPDFPYASKIVRWLVQRMDSHGGFASSQDTTICLLAITSYMKLTFSNDRNTVTFTSEESMEIFQINSDNRLLVQRSELTEASGEYMVDVEGQGCAFIQATVKFNVPLPKKASGFALSVEVKNTSSDMLQAHFDLTVTLQYTGTHNQPRVVLVDVKMLSGFSPVMASMEQLENNGHVMKTEVKSDHVLFYLENVFDTANNFTFSIEQSNPVSNIQPAPVVVYNYYEKDEYAFDSYNIENISVSQ